MAKSLFVAILFLVLAVTCSFGQPAIPKDVSRLYKDLANSKPDTSRVKILISFCRYYNANSFKQPKLSDSSLIIAIKAKSLSEKLGYDEGIGLSYQVMAKAWCDKKQFKKSDSLVKDAITIFLKNNLYRDAAEAYLNMEEFYLSAGGKDYQLMIGFYEQAQPLFHKANAFEREGATLERLGDFYQQQGNVDKSYITLKQSLALYKKTKFQQLQGVYDLLGYTAMQSGNYQSALQNGLLAAKTAESLNDKSLQLCTIYNRIGLTYNRLAQYEESAKYYKNSLNVAVNFKDTATILQVMFNYANALLHLHKSPLALQMVKYYTTKYPITDIEYRLMMLTTLVALHLDLDQVNSAGIYCSKMLALVNLPGVDNHVQMSVQLPAAKYFIASKQFQKAREHLNIYKKLSYDAHFSLGITNYYKYSFKIDSLQKQYFSALNNYQQYTYLRDSVFNIKKSKQIEELKIKYETEQKELNIAGLEKNSVLQQQSVKRADTIRNLTIAGSMVLLLLTGLLYQSFRINKRNAAAISRKNGALHQLVTEKEWLIKEIHHRVKNNLQIVTGLLQRQSAYIDNDEALLAIQNSENRMHAIALIHQKLYQSESLDLISMQDYIEEMLRYLKDSCTPENRIVFEKHIDDISLDVAQAVPLGLILNEAITNAIKYAYKINENGTIYITLVKNEDQCNQLTIADNGPGLPEILDLDKIDSLGINLMRGLCKQLGGSFEIINEQGCTINITFKTEIFSKAANRG